MRFGLDLIKERKVSKAPTPIVVLILLALAHKASVCAWLNHKEVKVHNVLHGSEVSISFCYKHLKITAGKYFGLGSIQHNCSSHVHQDFYSFSSLPALSLHLHKSAGCLFCQYRPNNCKIGKI